MNCRSKRTVDAFLVLLILAPALSVAAEVPFADRQAVTDVLPNPLQFAAGDIDGDGDFDIAAVADDRVVWYENLDGAGLFSLERVINLGLFAGGAEIALGDVDMDGDLDIVAASNATNSIVWYVNLGGGDFGDPLSNELLVFNPSGNTTALAVVDLDRDGDLDVVSASDLPGEVTWYENIGSPTLGPWPGQPVAGFPSGVVDIAIADIDNDAEIDIVTALDAGEIRWYKTDSGGAVTFLEQTVALIDARSLAIADVDGDGDLDILNSVCPGGDLVWHLNDGTPGGLGDWVPLPAVAVNPCPDQVVVADVDRDGDQDMLSASLAGPTAWYENLDGAGTFGGAIPFPMSRVPTDQVAVADVDGDGDPDVLSIARIDMAIDWSENRTIHGTAVFPQSDGAIWDFDFVTSDAADIDGDGDLDPLGGSFNNQTIQWSENLGGLDFGGQLDVTSNSPGTEDIIALDLDRDGTIDVAAVKSGFSPSLSWYPNPLRDGAFPFQIDIPAFDTFVTLAGGDLDGDADLDLFAGGASGVDGVLQVFSNDGAGAFLPQTAVLLGSSEEITSIALGDIDIDGDLDVLMGATVCATCSGGLVSWLENTDGMGLFFGVNIANPSRVYAVALADIDRDGALDAVYGTETGIAWLRNEDGAGGFALKPGNIDSTTEFLEALAAVDLDRDGDIDIVATYDNDLSAAWYENLDGAGSFGPQRSLVLNQIGTDIHPADLDGDGDLDLLHARPGDFAVFWLENVGGQYTLETFDAAPAAPTAGEQTPLLEILLTVHARPGDSAAELATLDLLFEDAAGNPLTSAQANALIENLLIYRDDDDGSFDPTRDILVESVAALTLTGGETTLVLADGDNNLRVAAPARFYVVAELTADAHLQVPNTFRVTHQALTSSTVEDATFDILLTGTPTVDVASSFVMPLGPIPVDSFADVIDPMDGVTSLREAIIQANANPGEDRILLQAGTYLLAIAGTGEDGAMTGDLDFTDGSGPAVLIGAGASRTTIDGGGIDRVFDLRGGSATFQDVTITGGNAPVGESRGGGIGHFCCGPGVTTLIDSVVTANMALFSGGIDNNSPLGSIVINGSTIAGNAGSQGSAVSIAFGSMSIDNSTISGNDSGSGALVIGQTAAVDISNSTITGNTGGPGINNAATVNIRNSIVAGNDIDVSGPFNSLGHNIIGDPGGGIFPPASGFIDGVNGDQVGGAGVPAIDPLLAALEDNGGETLTHRLQAGSPAIDAGQCSPNDEFDQRGARRGVDSPLVVDAPGSDGCDVGSVEAELAETVPQIIIPMRWCAVAGAPSIPLNPLPGDPTANDILRQRHTTANDEIFIPRANIRFRSGATAAITDYPILTDPDTTIGLPGDVLMDVSARNYEEFHQLIADCRLAWEQQDPTVEGITAVQINRFIDPTGAPLAVLGVGGRAAPGSVSQQAIAGRVMIADGTILAALNPPDVDEKLLAHELAHAISLPHGNGIDDDGDGILDNGDEVVTGASQLDGPNLMQYRVTGEELTILQAAQARLHAASTIPDIAIALDASLVPDGVGIDPGFRDIIEFGFRDIIEFGFRDIIEFGFRDIIEFGEDETLGFGFIDIIEFGALVDDPSATGETTLFASTAGLLWPDPVRADAYYYFYIDTDLSGTTGGTPLDFGFPTGGGTPETGIDLIVQVETGSTGETLTVYDFIDTATGYVVVANPVAEPIVVDNIVVSLYQDPGGGEIEEEEQAIGTNLRATVRNSVLQAAGWQVGSPFSVGVLSVLDCTGTIAGIPIDCQCTDCADCPDYPGCDQPTPAPVVVPDRIVVDNFEIEASFDDPVPPVCSVAPGSVTAGGSVTMTASEFPSGTGKDLQVRLAEQLLAMGQVDAGGTAVVPAIIPAGTKPGERLLTAVLEGGANAAECNVQVIAAFATCSADEEPPVLEDVPDPIVVEQTNLNGTPVTVPLPGVMDTCDPTATVTSDAPAVFPLGTTDVTFTAMDRAGNTSTAMTSVTVIDTTAPVLANVPAPIQVELEGPAGTPLIVPLPDAADICDVNPQVTSDAPAIFPLGTTMVTFTAIDVSGNMATAVTSVTVVDTTNPVLTVSPDRDYLWPPNHRLVDIGLLAAVSDNSGDVPVVLESVVSSEADDVPGGGDGKTTGDIVTLGSDPREPGFLLKLRAERSGQGGGRLYTMVFSATDPSGNSTSVTVFVQVPHDRSGIIEPLNMTFERDGTDEMLFWNTADGAFHYNLVRARHALVSVQPMAIDLGAVECVAGAVTQTAATMADNPPALGELFIYFVEYDDGKKSGFGTVSVPMPRLPAAGSCP